VINLTWPQTLNFAPLVFGVPFAVFVLLLQPSLLYALYHPLYAGEEVVAGHPMPGLLVGGAH